MSKNWIRKALPLGAVAILLLAGLSPVYATFEQSESKQVESIESESFETSNYENINQFYRESFMDKYDSSEIEERYRNNPYLHRHDQHNPIRKPTVIDGVDGSWDIIVPEDYRTIQEAIDNANMGFRILVRSGIYYESVEIDVQSLTLHGEDREFTFIDGNGKGNVIMVTSSADGVNISGFTIRNSGNENFGILISSNYNIIKDNIFENNNIGIKLQSSSGNQIWDNEIKDNSNDGILLHRSYANNITGNNIDNNDDGIRLTGSSDNSIYQNNFIDNKYHAFFEDSKFNIWVNNYWSDWPGIIPRPIKGRISLDFFYEFPWINLDWFPRLKPYDMGG